MQGDGLGSPILPVFENKICVFYTNFTYKYFQVQARRGAEAGAAPPPRGVKGGKAIEKDRAAAREQPNGPSGPRRFCAVQAFSPVAKTLAQGQQGELPQSGKRGWPGPFTCPEHIKSKGGAAQRAAEPKKKGLPVGSPFFLEQVRRIELPYSAWEADVLPLNYTCDLLTRKV